MKRETERQQMSTVQIHLGGKRGGVALVDADDLPKVQRFKWSMTTSGYARAANGSAPQVRMHRVIMGVTDPKIEVDHRNGDRLDNRKSNLRLATHAENQHNRTAYRKNKCGGLKGVHRRGRKFAASITFQGRTNYLGSYATAVEAHSVYVKAMRELHGDFANDGHRPFNRRITMSIEDCIKDHAAAIRELAAAILGTASAAKVNTTSTTRVNGALSALEASYGKDAETEQAVAKVEASANAEKAAAKNAASAAGTATAAADTQSTAGAADTAAAEAQTSYDYAKDVQPLLVKVGKNRDQLVALLKSFGAAKGADIKPADYAAVIAKANELIAG